MFERLNNILSHIESKHLAKLWLFYRKYFKNDEECLQFLFEVFQYEPISFDFKYSDEEDDSNCIIDQNGEPINDSVFIPRRMLNAVERLVSAARDMDQIRRGKDIFKIIFIVTCIETIQTLSGKNGSKKELLFSFFKEYVCEEDKAFISKHFRRFDDDFFETKDYDEDSFTQFVGMLNEYRNCATHEGEYWECCFNNNQDDTPSLVVLKIDLEKYTPKNKKTHNFETLIKYRDFESIFMRACICFIRTYIKQKS